MMEISFGGKRVLVTGAGKGIGRCIVQELVKANASVIALSRTESSLVSLKAELPCIETICCDLSDWDRTRSLLEKIEPVHMLVNNAAVAVAPPFLEQTQEQFDYMMDCNVKQVFNVSQVIIKKMVESGIQGSIVNISSQASMAGLRNHYVYSSTKGAMDSGTRVLAVEFGCKGIRVNAVNPTVISTEMSLAGWSVPEKKKWILDRIPLGRFGEPIEVARPVLFLLSDMAAMITGVCLPIDGGFLAHA